jgi:hypothetical protein
MPASNPAVEAVITSLWARAPQGSSISPTDAAAARATTSNRTTGEANIQKIFDATKNKPRSFRPFARETCGKARGCLP